MAPSPGIPNTPKAEGLANGAHQTSLPTPPPTKMSTKRKQAPGDDSDETPLNKKVATNRKKAAKVEVSKHKECVICMDDVLRNQFPKTPHSFEDGDKEHDSDVCRKCWGQYLKAEVQNNGSEAVDCPQCSKTLAEFEVRKLARSKTYRDYLDKAAKDCMREDEEFRACPNAKCGWGAFFAGGEGNIFKCQACGLRHCLVCDVRFHEGQTCDEYDESKRRQAEEENDESLAAQRRAVEEQASLEAVQEFSKPCPKCSSNIQKISGCDHMTCRRPKCGFEFCWLCLVPYNNVRRQGNAAHLETCRHHPRQLYPAAVDVPAGVNTPRAGTAVTLVAPAPIAPAANDYGFLERFRQHQEQRQQERRMVWREDQ